MIGHFCTPRPWSKDRLYGWSSGQARGATCPKYLLDEPEAALSPSRQLAAMAASHKLVLTGSQFIIATHSPILLAYPSAKILRLDGSGISEVAYTDTEHYAVTRDFLNHYERRLQQLLGDEDSE
jgi:predicted ATPase